MTGTVVEVLWSSTGKRRANIVRRADGLFQVEVERLRPAAPEVEEQAQWVPHGRATIMADTHDKARELAAAELAGS